MILLHKQLLLFLVPICRCFGYIMELQLVQETKLTELLISIDGREFNNLEVLTLCTLGSNRDVFEKFGRYLEENLRHSILLLAPEDDSNNETIWTSFRSDAFVIHCSLPGELQQLCATLPLRQWHKLIIVVSNYDDLSHFVKVLWAFYLSKFLIISQDYKVYAWFPFGAGNCGNDFGRLMEIDEPSSTLFPQKLSNLNGCPVNVKLQYVPPIASHDGSDDGAQNYLLSIVARLYNFTPVVRLYDEEDRIVKLDYLLKGLDNGTDDLALPLDALTLERHLKYDYSNYYYEDTDIFCIKTPGNVPKIFRLAEILYTQFEYTIYALLIYVLITYAFARFIKNAGKYRSFLNIFHYYLRIILTAPNNNLPKNTVLRILYSSWLLYALVFSTNFTSLLFKNFQKTPAQDPDISMRLLSYPKLIPIYINQRFFELLEMEETIFDEDVFQICNDPLRCSMRVVNGEKLVIVLKDTVFTYHFIKFKSPQQINQLLCYTYRISSMNFFRFFMKRNYFLKDLINVAVDRITAGNIFTAKILKIMKKKYIHDYAEYIKIMEPLTVSGALKFKDFMVIFIYIIVALLLTILVFGLEILYHKFASRILAMLKFHLPVNN